MGRLRSRPDTQHLPPYIRKKGKRFYAQVTNPTTGKRTELAAGATVEEARAFARLHGISDDTMRQYVAPPGFLNSLIYSVRTNARTKGVPCTLALDDLRSMLDRSDNRCAVSGVRFEYSRAQGERFRPWAPSVDRINPRDGYVPANCRIVCAYVNLAMNHFGEATFRAIALYVAGSIRRSKKPPKRGIIERSGDFADRAILLKLVGTTSDDRFTYGGETGIRTLDTLPYT